VDKITRKLQGIDSVLQKASKFGAFSAEEEVKVPVLKVKRDIVDQFDYAKPEQRKASKSSALKPFRTKIRDLEKRITSA
jgi:hypothetical protein